MTSKNELLNAIRKLKNYFKEDSYIQEALSVAQGKVFDHYKGPSESQGTSEKYPLEPKLLSYNMDFYLFSDGGCRGNPGPGAWGHLIQAPDGSLIAEDMGGELMTTNNRMEMIAGLSALEKIVELFGEGKKVALTTDSQYLIKGMDSWMHGWKKRGWKKADKKAPENLDLWKRLDLVKDRFAELKLLWVKGHDGHPQNERCDQLVNQYLDQMR